LTWLVERRTLAPMARVVKQSRAVKPTGMYDVVLDDIVGLIEVARRRAARMVNATMTAVYWSIGRRIVVEEQRGARRAEYGEELIEQLAQRLTVRFGRGFGRRTSGRCVRSIWPTPRFSRHHLENLQAEPGTEFSRHRLENLSAAGTAAQFFGQRLDKPCAMGTLRRSPRSCRFPGPITSSS
jgi:uncharacterized protein DUF1016